MKFDPKQTATDLFIGILEAMEGGNTDSLELAFQINEMRLVFDIKLKGVETKQPAEEK